MISIGSFERFPLDPQGCRRGDAGRCPVSDGVDQTTVVVAGWPGLSVGDEVTLFGAGERGESSATTLAERIDTVGEEIPHRLTARVRRVVQD